MKLKNQNYPILIAATHISELNAVEHTTDGIRFGASVTLTTLEDVLKEVMDSLPGTYNVYMMDSVALYVRILVALHCTNEDKYVKGDSLPANVGLSLAYPVRNDGARMFRQIIF